jgi:N-acetylmuramoyl-L-alanine amidase
MRDITKIIIHCSDTPEDLYFDVDDIRGWHVTDNGWDDIGYHYVILLDGTIQEGRDEEVIGAHCFGHNKESIGICYIGGGNKRDTRTTEQKRAMYQLLLNLKLRFTDAVVHGHNEFSNKYCPNFDANLEYNCI